MDGGLLGLVSVEDISVDGLTVETELLNSDWIVGIKFSWLAVDIVVPELVWLNEFAVDWAPLVGASDPVELARCWFMLDALTVGRLLVDAIVVETEVVRGMDNFGVSEALVEEDVVDEVGDDTAVPKGASVVSLMTGGEADGVATPFSNVFAAESPSSLVGNRGILG